MSDLIFRAQAAMAREIEGIKAKLRRNSEFFPSTLILL
jgi:hypothetical protein